MALTFGAATSDRVACGSNAVLDNLNPLTILAWVYPTTLTAGRFICNKGTGLHTQNGFPLSGTGGDIEYIRGRATTDADRWTNSTPLATLNKWYCVAATFDSTQTPNSHIYTGTLTTMMAEATYNASSADGSGAVFDDSANNFVIGNKNAASFNSAFQGRLAVLAYFNRVLTLGEIKSWQFNPRKLSGCVGFWILGFNGTGNQPDLSGNFNAGTVTGAAVSGHVPLRPAFGALEVGELKGVSAQQYSQSADGTLTLSGLLINQGQKIFAGGWSGSGALIKQDSKILAATLTDSGALIKQSGKVLAGGITPSGVLAASKTVLVALLGTLTTAGALVKQTAKPLAATLTDSGALIKQTGKALAGGLTSSGVLTSFKVALVSLIGTLTSSGALAKQTGKLLTGTLTDSGVLVKQTTKNLSAGLTSSGAFAGTKVALKALGGTLSASGELIRQAGKVLAAGLAPSGALARQTQVSAAGTLTSAGFLQKQIGKSVSGILISLGDLVTQWFHVAVVKKRPLTLYPRSEALTLELRALGLSLPDRTFTFTLEAE